MWPSGELEDVGASVYKPSLRRLNNWVWNEAGVITSLQCEDGGQPLPEGTTPHDGDHIQFTYPCCKWDSEQYDSLSPTNATLICLPSSVTCTDMSVCFFPPLCRSPPFICITLCHPVFSVAVGLDRQIGAVFHLSLFQEVVPVCFACELLPERMRVTSVLFHSILKFFSHY